MRPRPFEGLVFTEHESLKIEHTLYVMAQNVMDACVGALVWYGWGHSFAHGENGLLPNGFIGGTVSELLEVLFTTWIDLRWLLSEFFRPWDMLSFAFLSEDLLQTEKQHQTLPIRNKIGRT